MTIDEGRSTKLDRILCDVGSRSIVARLTEAKIITPEQTYKGDSSLYIVVNSLKPSLVLSSDGTSASTIQDAGRIAIPIISFGDRRTISQNQPREFLDFEMEKFTQDVISKMDCHLINILDSVFMINDGRKYSGGITPNRICESIRSIIDQSLNIKIVMSPSSLYDFMCNYGSDIDKYNGMGSLSVITSSNVPFGRAFVVAQGSVDLWGLREGMNATCEWGSFALDGPYFGMNVINVNGVSEICLEG